MTVTLCLQNRKGGVGKTTSTAALAGEFAGRGLRVLAVDFDPQGSLSLIAGYGPEAVADDASSLALVLPDLWDPPVDPAELPVDAPWGGQIIPANSKLGRAIPELLSRKGQIKRLDLALAALRDQYDLVLIDTGPGETVLVHNALMASDGVIIPVELSFQAVLGVRELLDELGDFIRLDKPTLKIVGVVGTKGTRTLHSREIRWALYGPDEDARQQLARGRLTQEELDTLAANALPEELRLDRVVIPDRVAVQDTQGQQIALRDYDPDGAATVAYAALADAIERRMPELSAAVSA